MMNRYISCTNYLSTQYIEHTWYIGRAFYIYIGWISYLEPSGRNPSTVILSKKRLSFQRTRGDTLGVASLSSACALHAASR